MPRAFVGRSSEVELVRAALDGLSGGRGAAVVVEGAAGIGKSRLVDDVMTYARHRGIRVSSGAGDELQQGRPYGALPPLLVNDADGAMAAQLPSGESVAQRVEEQCARQPLLLVVEDAHWADPSTLRALRGLARRIAQFPLGIVVTLRPLPSSRELQLAVADLQAHGARHVLLDRLGEQEVTALAADVLGAEVGPNLRMQLRSTGGNPLYVIELLEALRAEGAVSRRANRADVPAHAVPASLQLTILRRLAFLPEETLELLKLASVLGATFSLADLAAFTGRAAVDLLPALTAAIRSGVVGEDAQRLTFRHDLVRHAIYDQMPESVRRDLHREAGRALAAAGAVASTVAEQLSLGASPGDSEAVRWLRAAAEGVGPASAVSASRFLMRALELAAMDEPARPALLSEAAVALLATGRLEDAERLTREAMPLADDPAVATSLRRTLATITFLRGDRASAVTIFQQSAGSPASADDAATDLALASLAATYAGDAGRAYALAEQAQRRAAPEDAFARSTALMTLSVINRCRGDVQSAVELAAEAVQLAAGSSSPLSRLYLHPAFPLGAACLEADRLDDAETQMRRIGDGGEWSGRVDLPWFHMYLGAKHFMDGSWDDAVAEAEAGLALVREMDFSPFASRLFPQGLLAVMAFYRGDLQSASAAVAVADAEIARAGPQPGIDVVLWAKALVLEATGDAREALPLLEGAWMLYGAFGYQIGHRWVAPELVRLAVSAGAPERAAQVVREVEALAQRADVASARGVALRCRALLEADADVFAAAADAYGRGPRRFEAALAAADAAVAAAAAGRSELALSLAAEATAGLERAGAARALAALDARLREHGVTRRRRGRPRRQASTGWESLTPSEVAVTRLVAEGLTNRAIGDALSISARTAETHVAHVFTKLGITSRAALAAAVARRAAETSAGADIDA